MRLGSISADWFVDQTSELFGFTNVGLDAKSEDVRMLGDARKRLSVESPGAGPEPSCCRAGCNKCISVLLVDVPRSLEPDQFCSTAEIRSPYKLCLSSTLIMTSRGDAQRARVDPVLLSHKDAPGLSRRDGMNRGSILV